MKYSEKVKALREYDCAGIDCMDCPAFQRSPFQCATSERIITGLSETEIDDLYDKLIAESKVAGSKVDLFREITAKMADTYEAKNHDYGDSFSLLRAKYPESICIRLMDKLLRLERLIGGQTAMVSESIEDTLLDIANYAVMELVERRLEHEN